MCRDPFRFRPHRRLLTAALLALIAAPSMAQETVVTFDLGAEGWVGPSGSGGATVIDPAGGNPGANLHTVFNDFGITFHNDTNTAFVFDYTTVPSLSLGLDLLVESIDFSGIPVSRPWLVELRDRDNPPGGFPWVSVWFKFADISAADQGDWTTFDVEITDTAAVDLPPGWGGFGAEDGGGNPTLPANRTFTDVLAGIDEIAFTTLEPGFFFGFTDHDLRLDNIRIQPLGPFFADGFESGDTAAWSTTSP